MLSRRRAPARPTLAAAAAALLAACALEPTADGPTRRPPNIVLVLADDMGDAGLSCTGNAHWQTPHLDRMAREGLRFTDFHSSGAVCSPTRAGLLTGRYQQRTGVDGVINADPKHESHGNALPKGEITFAEALRERGYRTAIFGKWHLGYAPEHSPIHHGFDEFVGFVSGNVDYLSQYDRMGTKDWWRGDQLVGERGYTTELITQHALDFLDRHGSSERPFCLYLPHAAIHNPNQGPTDPPIRGPERRPRRELQPKDAAIAAMTRALDDSVGQVLGKLQELGIDEDTLVIFVSDNGGTRENRSTGEGIRGFKGSVWEGGHLVPAICRWPGTIPMGTTSNAPAITLDLMPTMLGLAGAPVPTDRAIDGVDLGPLLRDPTAELPDRDLFWQHGNASAVRHGALKLVRTARGVALFDLADDPGERTDLASEMPEQRVALGATLDAWRDDVQQNDRPQ